MLVKNNSFCMLLSIEHFKRVEASLLRRGASQSIVAMACSRSEQPWPHFQTTTNPLGAHWQAQTRSGPRLSAPCHLLQIKGKPDSGVFWWQGKKSSWVSPLAS